jgi:uncharacterized protein
MKRESIGRLLLGLGTGTVFGFLLQRGRVAKHEVIADALRLRDHTVVSTMATASAVGAIGAHALQRTGRVEPSIKPLMGVGTVLGAVTFGAGMAVLGYCPGTSIAAVGEGRKDAIAGVLGMMAGALAYVRAAPRLEPVLERGFVGPKTLPELTGTSPWIWVAGLSAAVAGGAALERRTAARQAGATVRSEVP